MSDPFLMADSLVIKGSAKVLVCCVGKYSTRGEYMRNIKEEIDEDT